MHGATRTIPAPGLRLRQSGPAGRAWLLACAAVGLLVGGCASMATVSPPMLNQTDAVRLSQSGQPTTVAELEHGRTLFVSRCASCHALPLPADYATDKWPRFIDEMATRAKLDGPEANAVLHYLLAARDVKVARR